MLGVVACLVMVQGILLLLLPLRQLVMLYMHYLTVALLAAADQFSRYYVSSESTRVEEWPSYEAVAFQVTYADLNRRSGIYASDSNMPRQFSYMKEPWLSVNLTSPAPFRHSSHVYLLLPTDNDPHPFVWSSGAQYLYRFLKYYFNKHWDRASGGENHIPPHS